MRRLGCAERSICSCTCLQMNSEPETGRSGGMVVPITLNWRFVVPAILLMCLSTINKLTIHGIELTGGATLATAAITLFLWPVIRNRRPASRLQKPHEQQLWHRRFIFRPCRPGSRGSLKRGLPRRRPSFQKAIEIESPQPRRGLFLYSTGQLTG